MADMNRQSVFQEALNLAELKFDWDSYQARPVSGEAIHAACEFAVEHVEHNLRALAWVVPTLDGGVQLEWHREGCDLEIAWAADGSFSSVFRNDELGRLPNLEFERPESATEVVASYAISAAADLAAEKA